MDETPQQRWQRIEALAREALERDAAERRGFLLAACEGDPDLAREALDLVGTYEQARRSGDTVLSRPRFEPPPVVELDSGQSLGPYKILQQIAQGSISTVYLGMGDAPPRPVAIKVAQRGFDPARLAQRFAAERQVLGRLEHPNIARLFDSGALDDGRPYVVMEYVDGLPIDEHCDQHRRPVRHRLELFRRVCVAVHCAHQNLVVHRDIKPSNVLVTRDGLPKLLDFGIALELGDGDGDAVAERPMTPPYASPEQIRGQEITPLSDVYSLGVLLFRLLTGQLPYGEETHGPREMARILDENLPRRPSATVLDRDAPPRDLEPAQLRRRLEGDLDRIVLKTIAQEPERRYATAQQLAEDVRRHLAGLPILAGSRS